MKLSQVKFAETLEISAQNVINWENGRNNPTDSAVKLLCAKLNVNEEWLREGKGDMFLVMSAEDEVDAFCGDIKHLAPDDPRRVIMRMLAKLPESDWIAIADMIKMIREDVPPEE